MNKYNLQLNESVILKNEQVYHEKESGELVLTNLNLFFIMTKGTFKTKYITQEYPINQIKIYDGKASIILGENGIIDIFFINGQETFRFWNNDTFGSGKKASKEAELWANSINKLLTGEQGDFTRIESKTENMLNTLKETAGNVGKTLKNTAGNAGKTLKNTVDNHKEGASKIVKGTVENYKGGGTMGVIVAATGIMTKISDDKNNDPITTVHTDEQTDTAKREEISQKPSTMSFDEQIETLKKLKELMDIGILSKDEFETKKKEIMGL